VRLVATSPAGQGLCLIGGFRYRFLDGGVRRSLDVDYHWAGDLGEKQAQLIQLFRRRLVPEVRRRFGHEEQVDAATGPDAESPSVRVINVAFWREGTGHSRIEIPVDVTRIVCLDPAIVRTVDGVVYPTASDADMVEGKVVALFTRNVMQYRDLVDLFLFANRLALDSPQRVRKKLAALEVDDASVSRRLDDLVKHRTHHVRVADELVASQLDPEAGASLRAAGGGAAVLDAVLEILHERLKLGGERRP